MIFDKLQNLHKYVLTEQFKKIQIFLKELSPNMEEKTYEIDGKNIFASVMNYSTVLSDDGKIEAHNEYIDIQASLVGAEGIDIFDRSCLEVLEDYDRERDIVFYKETVAPNISVNNVIGYFTMIFPYEAHRPQISLNRMCEDVKKLVIKIHV